MPLYEYYNCETGQMEERLLPLSERDNVPGHLRRVPPSRLGYVAQQRPLPSFDQKNQTALAKLENSIGRQELERQSGYSTRALQEVWNN